MKRGMKTRNHRCWSCALAVTLAVLLATAAFCDLPKKLKFDPIEFKKPEVEDLEFSNGLHGYLIEDHSVPVVDIIISFRVGYPPEDKIGLSDLTGWAIRNGGSENYSADVIDDELEFIGASIESRSGANSTRITANFLTKDTDAVLAILADLIINPAFDPDKIELKKKSEIEDIRRKNDDPRSLGRREFVKLIYRDHPAGWEPTVATVSSLTRDDVIDFYRKHAHPDNAVIGVSGDITAEEILSKLGDLLAGWDARGEPPSFPEMKYEMVPSVNYIYKDVNQAYIFAGHMATNIANEDNPYARIMNYILGGGSFTSWITQRIRSDEGLAYSARSSFRESAFGYGLFTGSCQTKSDAAMRALTLLIEQIEKMNTEGPSEEEVAEAKEALVNRQVFEYESAGQVVRRLVWYDLIGLPLDTQEKRFAAIQGAGVDDIRRVGSEYLHPDGLTILVVGNQDLFDRPLSDFGEVNVIEIEQEEE